MRNLLFRWGMASMRPGITVKIETVVVHMLGGRKGWIACAAGIGMQDCW